jgi:predicted nuclease with RNAse H fold
MRVMGLDLAGMPQNPSGVALLRGKLLRTMLVYEDLEVEELCRREGVRLVAVDAPLSLPARGFRPSDLALLRMGFRVFPPTFAGMRSLTLRGISLSRRLRGEGVRVIEVHPRTSGRILFGTPNRVEWARLLARRGWRVKGGTGGP